MLLSATSEALARLRVSDLTAAAPCGPSLFEHTGFCKQGGSRPRYESGATGVGKLENGSRSEAISEIARLRRSLPEPDPENRAAISIRSARPPIITVIGASPEGPRPRPRRGRWSRLENRLGTWSRDSRLRLPRRALPAPGGRQLLCSRPSRRLEGRLLSDVAHDPLPRHADLVVVARLSNPHDGALVLTPPNHDSNLGPVVPMRAVGNVVEARERIFALLVAPQHFRVRHDDQVNLMLAGKPLQGPQRKPGIFGRRQMGRPVVLDLVPGIDDQ